MTGRIRTQTLLLPFLILLVVSGIAGCGEDARTTTVATSTDIEFVIEPGALARQMRGEIIELIPIEIELSAGQSIVIHNQDQALHYFLSSPVWPGETLTQTFDEPGVYRYSGAFTCSIGSSTSLTVTVRDAAAGSNSPGNQEARRW